MKLNMKPWVGQISTMLGALIAAPVTVALIQRQISVEQAIPGILAALVGLIWPENQGLSADVEDTATQVVHLLPALVAAYEHGRVARRDPANSKDADSSGSV